MKEIRIESLVREYDNEKALSAEEQKLVTSSREAVKHAYAPYSGFSVGASILLSNGIIVTGNNQENAAYPSGLCAERVAVFAASAQYPGVPIKAIAITAQSKHFIVDSPVSPCGACRQVLAEYEHLFNNNIKVILSGQEGKIMVLDNVKSLLPLLFDASKLSK